MIGREIKAIALLAVRLVFSALLSINNDHRWVNERRSYPLSGCLSFRNNSKNMSCLFTVRSRMSCVRAPATQKFKEDNNECGCYVITTVCAFFAWWWC